MASPPSLSSISKETDDRDEMVVSLAFKEKLQDLKFGDAALAVLDETTIERQITPEEDARVLRKIDLWVLPVIFLVYFLQQLDKSVVPAFYLVVEVIDHLTRSSVSYTSVFGLVEQARTYSQPPVLYSPCILTT
jgi:hypothetical protein